MQIIVGQIEPLTEQQMMGLYSLRTSTDQAESTLTQGLENLQRSLSDAIASNELSHPSNVSNYIGQMSMAVSRLSTLEGLVRQVSGPSPVTVWPNLFTVKSDYWISLLIKLRRMVWDSKPFIDCTRCYLPVKRPGASWLWASTFTGSGHSALSG